MNRILLSTVVVSSILFSGCKSGGGNPKTVLISFFDALAKEDFTTAKKYTTKDSEGMMSMMQMGMQNISDTSSAMKFTKENLQFGDPTINGDIATVPVKEKRTGEATDFTLKKESGEWKVAFDKSTLMNMAQQKMKEHSLGGMRPGMSDSLDMNDESVQNMDSASKEEIQHAQKMLDSANKMLNKAKEDAK